MKPYFALLITFALLVTACGGDESNITNTQDNALKTISAYAQNSSSIAPTLQNYVDAGVKGVTSENLAELNTLVNTLETEDVNTVEELNTLVLSLDINIIPDESNITNTQDNPLETINAYAQSSSNIAPTLQNYVDAGVKGVTSENLAELNTLVNTLETKDVDTVEELNILVLSLDINIIPVANSQSIIVDEDTTDNRITLTGSDDDGHLLTYAITTQPTHGTLTLIGAIVKYTPTVDYAGEDSFSFKVNDGTLDSVSAIVRIIVRDVVEPPITLPVPPIVPTFPPIHSIVGTWRATDKTSNDFSLLSFFDDNTYMQVELALYDDDPKQSSGMEWGRYSHNKNTGKVTIAQTVDNNGNRGLSAIENGVSYLILNVSKETLTATIYSHADNSIEKTTTFKRVVSVDILGTWRNTDTENDFSLLSFFNDNTYIHAEIKLDGDNPDKPSGVEWGTYSHDEQTGKMTVTPIFDNNRRGLSDFTKEGTSDLFLDVSKDTLTTTIDRNMDQAIFFKRQSSILINTVQTVAVSKLDEAISGNFVAALAPVFDFDTDGCLPSTGIDRTGQQNPGLATSGSITQGCRDNDFLDSSNTLHRYACTSRNNIEYCGHFYALYFEKDHYKILGIDGGHRHDWEVATIWTTDGVITHGGASAHGNINNKAFSELPLDKNGHMKIVYHKDGLLTHALRFASHNEEAENSYGSFVTPTIISWDNLIGDDISNSQMRTRLNNFDYGSATIPLKRNNFFTELNRFKPSSYPTFQDQQNCHLSSSFSEENANGQRCPENYVVTGIKCSGRYCDNKQLQCCKIPGLEVSGSVEYSPYFSEEGKNFYQNDKEVVVGMRCTGRYCDNISLITKSTQGTAGIWTTSFSEEEGEGNCGGDAYVSGVKCSGRYCDNLSLYCNVSPDNLTKATSDAVFNDIEANYDHWVPTGPSSQTQGDYYYRFYPNGSYLLRWNDDLWYDLGSGWVEWGPISNWK